MLKPRMMSVVLNFQINEVLSVLCFYLINISVTFSIFCIYISVLQFNSLHLYLYAYYVCCIRLLIYTYIIQVIYGRMRIQFQMRQRQTEEAWSTPYTHAPPTTSTVPTSTTPTTATTSTHPGHPLHAQEFGMIPNLGYVEPGSQPSFPPQPTPSLPPPPGGKDHTSPIPSSNPSPTPNQPGSQGAQASLSALSQGSTNQRMELKYDCTSW